MSRSSRICWRFLHAASVLATGLLAFETAAGAINGGQDLQSAINWRRSGQSGCVRLLNATQEVGCGSNAYAEGPVTTSAFTSGGAGGLPVVLVNSSALPDLLEQLAEPLQPRVAGILVAPDALTKANLDSRSPQQEFANYGVTHAWNPAGNGLMHRRWPFPIHLLDSASADHAAACAAANGDLKGSRRPLYFARLDSTMQGAGTAFDCLADDSCDPLGGHSVWSSMPPFQPARYTSRLPITVVMAQSDSLGFFHDESKGADAPMSGLATVLAAAQVLSRPGDLEQYKMRLVFVAFAGDPWGLMGSKRFLWELSNSSAASAGVQLGDIEKIVEVGQVGRASNLSDGTQQLYLHTPTPGETTGLQQAFEASSAASKVTLERANSSNPGLPPSSSAAFLRVNRSLDAAFLAEFDTAYTNTAYATSADTLPKINQPAVASAAVLLARTLHRIATGADSIQVDLEEVSRNVSDIMTCLASEDGILSCPIAERLISLVGSPSNYVSVLRTLTKDPQDANIWVKNDMSRFLWNVLAETTSSGPAKLASGEAEGCNPYERPCEEGAACVGYRVDVKPPEGRGQCLFASPRYVPAYSTSLECKDCSADGGRWIRSQSSLPWEHSLGWPPDPVWTESRWDSGIPRMDIFLKEDPKTEMGVLIAGFSVTIATLIFVLAARTAQARMTSR